MSKCFCIAILLMFSHHFNVALAQNKLVANKNFLKHLFEENLEIERLAYYKKIDLSNDSNVLSCKDMMYLSAKYYDTLLFASNQFFAKDTNDLLHVFYSAVSLHLQHYYLTAYTKLEQCKLSSQKLFLLKDIIHFLQGDVRSSNQNEEFLNTISKVQKLEKKSVLIAALLSSILPGTGKYYLLQNSEATAMLILNVMSAGPLVECIIRFGLMSTGTWLAAIVFVPIYIANLYGTIISKKVLIKKLKTQLKNEIHDYCFYQLHH